MSELTITGRFDVAGVSLNYRVDGIGPRFLVCVHSEGARLEEWDSTIPELADAFTILRYDLRGHGMSTQGKSPSHINNFVYELMALVDHAQIEQFDLAGCSLGGLIALRTALAFNGRVRRLILLSAVAEDATNLDCYAAHGVMRGNDSSEEIKGIRCPTLILTGEEDGDLSFRSAQLMHDRIAGSLLEILPGLRHPLLRCAPQVVAARMRRFLLDENPGVPPERSAKTNT